MSLSTEIICAREIKRVLLRKPQKYWPLVPILYLSIPLNPKKIGIMRHGYAFMRHVDDVVDGDLEIGENPLSYIDRIKREMEKLPSNGELPIINTLDYILTKHKGIKDPRVHFSRLIDALMFDYERTRNRRVLTKEELDQHYRNTFFPLIDFMFESLDSELTAEDVPTLTYGQANWQSYKDINEDWSEGRINIPSEILKQANLNHNDPLEKVLKNYIIHDWFAETLKKTREDFKQLGVDYNNHPEPLPKLILMIASRYFTTIIPKL